MKLLFLWPSPIGRSRDNRTHLPIAANLSDCDFKVPKVSSLNGETNGGSGFLGAITSVNQAHASKAVICLMGNVSALAPLAVVVVRNSNDVKGVSVGKGRLSTNTKATSQDVITTLSALSILEEHVRHTGRRNARSAIGNDNVVVQTAGQLNLNRSIGPLGLAVSVPCV
jgi:hypothetical protein